MTHPRRHAAPPTAATETPKNIGAKKSHSARAKHTPTGANRNPVQTGPLLSRYGELFQDIQDELSYFLPVDALAAGTYRYLYHLGDYSPANILLVQQFVQEKRDVAAHMDQARLSNAEHRSALMLGPYLDSILALIDAGYFGDSVWQLRNARKGLYQLLYMTEIPMYIRGKALVHRLEELFTPPTAPAQSVQLRSSVDRDLALEELHLMQQYLNFAEDRASRFDDKQAIAERVQKARQYLTRVEPRLSLQSATTLSPHSALLAAAFPSLDEAEMAQAQDHLGREIENLKHQLGERAARLDASRPSEQVVEEVLLTSLGRHLDQATMDAWMASDYPRLRTFFPSYKLQATPVPAPEGIPLPPHETPDGVSLKGTSLERRQVFYPVSFSRRCLSPEIAMMLAYFPGRAYIQAAISNWDPGLPLHIQREVFVSALALFELQNIADLDGMMSPENALLTTLLLLIEDVAAAMDTEILQNRLTHNDVPTFLREQLPLRADLAVSFSPVVSSDFGLSLARFVLRSRFRELRRISRTSNKKISWTAFYRAILEHGAFDPTQLNYS